MTRKRFCKLCMSIGYSRNEANDLAARANWYGETYASRWEHEQRAYFADNFVGGLLEGMGETLSPVFEAVTATLTNVVAAVRELAEKAAPVFQHIVAQAAAYKLAPQDDELGPEPMWPKENPHLDGLRTDWALVDEMHTYKPGGGGND